LLFNSEVFNGFYDVKFDGETSHTMIELVL